MSRAVTETRNVSARALQGAGWHTGAKLTATLADLRRRYLLEVRAIASRLALDFQARKFDATKPEEEWGTDYPFNLLEHYCQSLPMCQDSQSARLILLVSKYADEAAYRELECGETTPLVGESWASVASHCLARDVHDYAIRRGWSRSRRERGVNWMQKRRARAASHARAAAR